MRPETVDAAVTRQQEVADLARIERAILRLPIAVRAESAALEAALQHPVASVLDRLHQQHLVKVDAVQTVTAAMDLLKRQNPSLSRAIDDHHRTTRGSDGSRD